MYINFRITFCLRHTRSRYLLSKDCVRNFQKHRACLSLFSLSMFILLLFVNERHFIESLDQIIFLIKSFYFSLCAHFTWLNFSLFPLKRKKDVSGWGSPDSFLPRSANNWSTTTACNRQQPQRDISHEALEPLAFFCADKEHS